MYKPKIIRVELSANFGILVSIPPKVTNEVISIGPRNQAKGTLRKSANTALGNDIIRTQIILPLRMLQSILAS